MANAANRAQKLAQKKKKRELKIKQQRKQAAATPEAAPNTPTDLAQCPLFECTVSDGWQKRGLAHIVVARKLPNDNLIVAGYFVDILCIGLKDTGLVREVTQEDYEETLKDNLFNDPVELKACDPSLAVAIIEGAIAFAEQFGFKPNKRWAQTSRMLEGIEPGGKKVVYGKKGKPCFVDRGETNARALIARLERKAGEGNFTVEEQAQ
jgi:hypothetical protein